MLRC
ncbi:hypothetical protein LINPERPRIM_LOCUS5084 [Linum perenne]